MASVLRSLFLISLWMGRTVSNPLWGWNHTHEYMLDRFPSPHQVNYIASSCGAGLGTRPSDTNLYAFACPHMMMFSEDMMLASKYDGLSDYFLYATAGSRTDDDCGICYHVSVEHEEDTSHRPLTHLIVQVINSGGDVGYQQLDLFVGAGGLGYYTSCNTDCESQYCNGGPCRSPLFSGTFDDWTNSEHHTGGDRCYDGGVKWFPPFDLEKLDTLCSNLFKDDDPKLFKNEQLYRSCMYSNKYFFHQNFGGYRSTRVQCPKGLYQLTGLRRSDDEDFPLPSLYNKLDYECRGATCITTMCDCCKPSCAWGNKGHPSQDWPSVRSCDKYGFPFQ